MGGVEEYVDRLTGIEMGQHVVEIPCAAYAAECMYE